MTPGAYLRLRREAAGLSINDVVLLVSDKPCWRDFNRTAIEMIEAGRWVPAAGFADRLRRAFPFDRYLLRQLICRLDPEPEICSVCGCSALDACDDEDTGPCAWADDAHALCTACAPSDGTVANPEEKRHA